MWNAIKSAASAIYNKIVPKKAPAAKPVKPGFVANLGAPTRKIVANLGRPTSNTVANLGVNRPTIAKNFGTVAQVQEMQRQAQIQQQAQIRRQNATNAVNAQTSKVSTWLTAAANKAKGVIGAPGKAARGISNIYYGAKDKRYQAGKLQEQEGNAINFLKARRAKADQTIAGAGKALANGDISAEQYNAVVQGERDKLTKSASFLNQDLRSRQDSINKPYEGRTADYLRKASNFFDPVGKVTQAAFTKVLKPVIEAPNRAVNTAINLANPGRRLEKGGHNYKKPPTYSEWVKSHGGKGGQKQVNEWQTAVKKSMAAQQAAQPQVKYSGGLLDRVKQAWGASANQRTLRQNPYSKTKSAIGNLATDPINYLPNMWGNKVASVVGKGVSKIPGAKQTGGFLKLTKDKLGNTKVGRAGAWLNKPINGQNNKFMQKYIDKANKDFKGLTPSEIQAYQDIMKAGGKVPAGYKMLGQGDLARVTNLTKSHTADYQKLYGLEKKAGLQYQPSKGYLPTRSELKDQASFLGLQKDAAPFFTRSKTRDNTYGSAEELAFARGYRGYASAKVRKQLPNQKFLSTDTSSIRGALRKPNQLWKKAVLKYNPAWYVHNLGWNIPASFMAGGVRTAGAYGKIGKAAWKEKTLNPRMMDSLPDGVVDKGSFAIDTGGAAGKLSLGTKIENLSRAAGYMGAKGKGLSDKAATKAVNRTLFDYSDVRNYERPALTAFPFWRFQKNITKLTAKMPFTHPRWAKAFNELKTNTMDRPYEQLKEAPQEQYNPETGKTEPVNLKERYKGKMKTPFGWSTNPFIPVLPETLSKVGINPWLGLTKRGVTGKDYFGNSVSGESAADFAGSMIPQYRVGKAVKDLVDGNGNNVEKWLSDTGYSKEAQGIDPSKPNYKASLDPAKNVIKALRSFTGIPNFTPDLDWKKYRENQNYAAFTSAYFGTDWYKRYPDFNQRETARKNLAKHFGFDLQKDLYDGRWSKYDSPATTKLKERKKAAAALQKDVYDMYNQIPKGKGNNGARGKFIQMWKGLMANTDMLDKNPDFMVFKNVPISGNKKTIASKYAASTKWGKGSSGSAMQPSAEGNFWKQYYGLDKDGRKALLAANPQYKKFGSKTFDPKTADLQWAYKNLPPDVRRNYLNKKYGKRSAPAEGWDAYLAARGTDFNSKFGRDLIVRPELGTKQLANVEDIVKSYAKPLPGKGTVRWGTPKRKVKYATRKRLTARA